MSASPMSTQPKLKILLLHFKVFQNVSSQLHVCDYINIDLEIIFRFRSISRCLTVSIFQKGQQIVTNPGFAVNMQPAV
jgi:hypothetical protein